MSLSTYHTSQEEIQQPEVRNEYQDLYWIYNNDDDEDLKISWPSIHDDSKVDINANNKGDTATNAVAMNEMLDTTMHSISDTSDVAPRRRDSFKLLGKNIKLRLPRLVSSPSLTSLTSLTSSTNNKMKRVGSECSISSSYPRSAMSGIALPSSTMSSSTTMSRSAGAVLNRLRRANNVSSDHLEDAKEHFSSHSSSHNDDWITADTLSSRGTGAAGHSS